MTLNEVVFYYVVLAAFLIGCRWVAKRIIR